MEDIKIETNEKFRTEKYNNQNMISVTEGRTQGKESVDLMLDHQKLLNLNKRENDYEKCTQPQGPQAQQQKI